MKRILILAIAAAALFSFSAAYAGEFSTAAVDVTQRDGYAEFSAPNNTRVVVFGSDEVSFQVASTLIIRNGNALLIDAKFTRADAAKIAAFLRDSGIRLTQIYISHGDPDYYFGLEEIKASHPNVIARATRRTTRHIVRTVLNKLETWAEALGDEAPKNVVFPKLTDEKRFEFEGLAIEIFGSDITRTTLYIPSLGMLVGGANITSGNHLFLADMSLDSDRESWLNSLRELGALDAEIVIPGHTNLVDETFDGSAIDFSIGYIRAANEILRTSSNSGEFITRMEERYPNLLSKEVLTLSGLVLTGEMPWRRYAED